MHGGTRSGNGVYVGAGFRLNGEFFRDCPSGTVEIDFANGDVYRGGMKNGSLHGRGRYVYKSGSSYEGEFYKGSMLGDCVMSYVQGEVFKYEGGNNEGLYDGLGVIYYRNGVIFRGWFNQGCKHGTGVLVCCRKTFKCVYSYDRLLGGLKPIVC